LIHAIELYGARLENDITPDVAMNAKLRFAGAGDIVIFPFDTEG
jgi:hypothetical protein